MERVGLFEKWGGESITWLLRKCISSGAACSSVQQFTAFLTAGEQLQVKQKWHYFRTRISVPEIWINTLQNKYLPVAHCQREGERARQKWCAFLKKNSTLIFFLFKLKAQYSQINNPFLDPKPEGKIHFWYSE